MVGIIKLGGIGSVALLLTVQNGLAATPNPGDWTVSPTASTSYACAGSSTSTPFRGGFFQRQQGYSISPACFKTSDEILSAYLYNSQLTAKSVVPRSCTPPPLDIVAPDNIIQPVTGFASFIELDPNNGGTLPLINAAADPNNPSLFFDSSASENAVIGPLQPGRHTLTWNAMNADGLIYSTDQIIDIIPTVNFRVDQRVQEGKYVWIIAYLNGDAVRYPITIPFTVINTDTDTSDHNARDGVITIESGRIGEYMFQTSSDSISEPDERITFQMGTPTNAVPGFKTQTTVTITEQSLTPAIQFWVTQNGHATSTITPDGGTASIRATFSDTELSKYDIDWGQSNNLLVAPECKSSTFYFEPNELIHGIYAVDVKISEKANPENYSTAQLLVSVDSAPTLETNADSDGDGVNDGIEGFGDDDGDGIPNHLDNSDLPNILPGAPDGKYKTLDNRTLLNVYDPGTAELGWAIKSTSEQINFPNMIETKVGLQLKSGNTNIWAYPWTSHVTFPWNKFSVADPLYNSLDVVQNSPDNFFVSLEIHLLPNGGASAPLVIPQTTAVSPPYDYIATVRTFSAANVWDDYQVDSDNLIASAKRNGDYCPAPGSSDYTPGLTDGFECLELTIKDGGPNDMDGTANGIITFTGGALIHPKNIINQTAPSTSVTEPPRTFGDRPAQSGELALIPSPTNEYPEKLTDNISFQTVVTTVPATSTSGPDLQYQTAIPVTADTPAIAKAPPVSDVVIESTDTAGTDVPDKQETPPSNSSKDPTTEGGSGALSICHIILLALLGAGRGFILPAAEPRLAKK